MKSAYELAMERLNRTSPSVKLTGEQKQRIADLESEYKARVADLEISIKTEMAKLAAEGNLEMVAELEVKLTTRRKELLSELEQKKEDVRTVRQGERKRGR